MLNSQQKISEDTHFNAIGTKKYNSVEVYDINLKNDQNLGSV